MPIRYKDPDPATAPPQHPLWGSLARLAAGVGTTLTQPAELTGLGMAIPAGIAGAGESLAEYLEGSKQSPARIATETALGAVPLSGIFKGGRALESAFRSGAYSGVGEAGREYAAGETLSPAKIGIQTGLGAGTAGLLSKFFGAPKAAATAAAAPGEFTVEQTSQKVRPKTIISKEPYAAPPMGPQPKPSGGAIPYKPPTGPGPIPEQPDVQYPLSERATARRTLAAEAKAARTSRKSKGEWLADEQAQTADDTRQETLRPPSAVEQVPTQVTEPKADIGAQVPEGAATPPLPEVQPFTKPKATAGERFNKRATKIADFFGVPAATPVTRIVDEGLPFASDKPETWVVRGHLDDRKAAQLNDMYKGGKGVVKKGNIEGSVNFNATDEFGNEIAPVKTEGMTFTPRLSEVAEATPHVAPMESAVETLPESNPFSVARAKKASDTEFATAQQKTFAETGQVLPREISVSPLEAHTMAPEPASRGQGGLWNTHPEVQAEADRLGEAYRSKVPGSGKDLAELRDFMAGGKMRESWRGAPTTTPEGPLAASMTPEASTPLPEAPIAPEAPGGQGGPPPPDYPAVTTREAIQDLLVQLNKLKGLLGPEGPGGSGERGAIDPRLMDFLTRLGIGTVGGGLMGAYYGHPVQGAMLGGLGGAFVSPLIAKAIPKAAEGFAASKEHVATALDMLNKVHNSALLSPTSLGKKLAADVGGLLSAALENPERAPELLKTLTGGGLREASQVGQEAFGRPITEAETGLESFAQKGPLSWIGRAMGGATAGTKNLLEQAGFSPEEQRYYTLTSKPQYVPTQKALEAIQGSKFLQHISPFARIAINRGERGIERSPFGALLALRKGTSPEQDISTLWKAALGTGIAGSAYEATPEDFVKQHPIATSLIAAAGGPYGIPIAAGMAAKTMAKSPGAEIAKTISRDVPGLRLIEDASQSPTALLRNYLSGYTNVLRPVAEAISPAEPDISGSVIDKTLSNVPGLREQLPKKVIPRGRPRRVRYE